jgi:hypothetical protein
MVEMAVPEAGFGRLLDTMHAWHQRGALSLGRAVDDARKGRPTLSLPSSEARGMAEIRTVTTLRYKRDEIRRAIRDYEKRLDQARADLAHIAAAIAIFEGKGQIPSFR